MTIETNALKSKVEKILKSIPEFITEETQLKLNVIKLAAEKGDGRLLTELMKDEEMKKVFFTPVLDSFVFNSSKFKEIVEYSSGCNSYSKYLGKEIGLYMGDEALTERNEVVLNFPFKDCILEGGQTKEDGFDISFEWDEAKKDFIEKKLKRREIFYNEVLAHDEIDNLLSPKAFCNARIYKKEGNKKCTSFTRNVNLNRERYLPDNTITDNLIIKGNNLLALHSLKREFAGKVKLIYIDPPYNTGNDGFNYNDNFNHSSWLTFMKNRLEIAKDLLKYDGCIFVQCDDNEQAYLKVLMDAIFGRENFLNTISVKTKVSSGASGGGEDKKIKKNIEIILFYCKHRDCFLYIPIYKKTLIDKYIFEHDDNNIGFYYTRILVDEGKKVLYKEVNGIKIYKHKEYLFETVKNIQKKENLSILEVYYKYFDKIFMVTNAQTSLLEKVNSIVPEKQQLVSFEYIPKSGMYKGKVTKKFIWNKTLVVWFADSAEKTENGAVYKKEEIGTLWDDISWGRLDIEGNVKLKSGKKPEKLLERIIKTNTNPSDIVLDFCLGSGTTAAVAHKMNRQYIGVEQMDYIETIAVERLKKVIEGEQGGISKQIEWQGGGSFVYLELAEKNEKAIRLISSCKNFDELIVLFDNLTKKYFLHYNVSINKFREEICEKEEFKSLALEKQKEMFIRMLDLNQLYINADDRYDEHTGLKKEDIAITENFYQL